MALKGHQVRLYLSNATIYRPGPKGFGWTVLANSLNAPIPCFVVPTPNYAKGEPLAGRMKENNVLTSDLIHFPYGTDIRDTDIVHIQPGSERAADEWMVVVSTGRELKRHANLMEVFCNPTPPLDSSQIS